MGRFPCCKSLWQFPDIFQCHAALPEASPLFGCGKSAAWALIWPAKTLRQIKGAPGERIEERSGSEKSGFYLCLPVNKLSNPGF
jgi:hypothetical protein